MSKAKPANDRCYVDGAKGACFIDISPSPNAGKVLLEVGWSCVMVSPKPKDSAFGAAEVPVSWLCELVAIATEHKDGLVGFLKEHGFGGGDTEYGGNSYALQVDPPPA